MEDPFCNVSLEEEDSYLSGLHFFLESGTSPNMMDNTGRSGLHIAAQFGHLRALDLLLRNGGDPYLADKDGFIPIEIAQQNEQYQIIEFLTSWCNSENYDNNKEKMYSITFLRRQLIDMSLANKNESLEDLFESFRTALSHLKELTASKSLSDVESNKDFATLSSMYESFVSEKLVVKPDCFHHQGTSEFDLFLYLCNIEYQALILDKPTENFSLRARNGSFFSDEEIDTKLEISDKDSEGFHSSLALFHSVAEEYLYSDTELGIFLVERRCPGNSTLQNGTAESVHESLAHGSNGESRCSMADSVGTITESVMKLSYCALRQALKEQGFLPGPVTSFTSRLLRRHLLRIRKNPIVSMCKADKVYSKELQQAVKDSASLQMDCILELENKMSQQFVRTDPLYHWRDGTSKHCFNYLLLDPRITKNLPFRSPLLSLKEKFSIFVSSIFYIGKGSRSRPYFHLYDAVLYRKGQKKNEMKVQRIRDIWTDGLGVVSLHLFQNTIPVEAWTREAAMISAVGIENVCNAIHGSFYGASTTWLRSEQRRLGTFLLYKALNVFLFEGERQLRHDDISIPKYMKRR